MFPYGLTQKHISDSVRATETYFNSIRVSDGAPHILELMPKSAISSLVSDTMIHYLASLCPSLVKNKLASGYPDLLPRSKYPNYAIKSGSEGIEIKASARNSAWDSHNIEKGWFLTVKYCMTSAQITISEICLAQLEGSDWSYSPRNSGSRRTATARINKSGLAKLKAGKVYST